MLLALSLLSVQNAHADEGAFQELRIEPYVMVQTWVTLYDMDVDAQADPSGYGDPEDDPGFKLRRARLGMTRAPVLGEDPADRLGFSLILGMSAGSDPMGSNNFEGIGLIDANFTVAATESLHVSAGLVKVPFGRENQFSSTELPFQDRAVQSNHLVSLREVGALAQWTGPAGLRVQGGVYNGNGSLLGDQDPNFLFAGRAEWTLGGDHRSAYRTFGQVDGLLIGVGGDLNINLETATTTLVTGGDVIVRYGGLTALAEGHLARITPQDSTVTAPGVLADTTRWGALAQVGYTFGEHWQPVVRWEIYDEDTSLEDNGDLMHVYAGVSSHWLDDSLRVGGGYVLRMEPQAAALGNDTLRLWTQFRF